MLVFFFQAEDGIRDLVRSRGLGDVYKRQRDMVLEKDASSFLLRETIRNDGGEPMDYVWGHHPCLLYTSDAADEGSSGDLGGRRFI